MSSRAYQLRKRWAARRALSDTSHDPPLVSRASLDQLPLHLISDSLAAEAQECSGVSGTASSSRAVSRTCSPVVWESGGSQGAWCGCAALENPTCSSPLHESLVGGLVERVCCLLEPCQVDVGVQVTSPLEDKPTRSTKPKKFCERQRSGHSSGRSSGEKSFDKSSDPPVAACEGKRDSAHVAGATGPPQVSLLSPRRSSLAERQRPRSRSHGTCLDGAEAGGCWPRDLLCRQAAMECRDQSSPGSFEASPLGDPHDFQKQESESFDQDELTSHLEELPSQMPRRESRTGIFNGLYTSISAATKLRLVHQLSVDETRSNVYADLAALATAPELTGAPPLPYTADLTPLKPAEKRRRFFQRKQTNSAPDSFDGNLPCATKARGPHSVSFCLDSALKLPTLLPWANTGKWQSNALCLRMVIVLKDLRSNGQRSLPGNGKLCASLKPTVSTALDPLLRQ